MKTYMKTHYTTTQSLLIKNVTTASYKEWKGKHNMTLNEAIAHENTFRKGILCLNSYLNTKENPDMWFFGKKDKKSGKVIVKYPNWKKMNEFVTKRLVEIFWVNKTAKAMKYNVKAIDNKKVKEQIDSMLDNITLKNAFGWRDNWNINYNSYINMAETMVEKNWNNGKGTAEIIKLFPTAYVYGERNTEYKTKWSELDNMKTAKEVYNFLKANKIYEINDSIKRTINRHAKKNGIFAKDVKEFIEEIDKTKPNHKEINQWFDNKSEEQKTNIVKYVMNMANGDMDKTSYYSIMVRAYGYKAEWFNKETGRMVFTDDINQYLNNRLEKKYGKFIMKEEYAKTVYYS